jgi:hypothetical protein
LRIWLTRSNVVEGDLTDVVVLTRAMAIELFEMVKHKVEDARQAKAFDIAVHERVPTIGQAIKSLAAMERATAGFARSRGRSKAMRRRHHPSGECSHRGGNQENTKGTRWRTRFEKPRAGPFKSGARCRRGTSDFTQAHDEIG